MGIYNCAPTLQEALDSLYAQTYQDFEIILCDDGSKDNTYEVALENQQKHPNIVLLKNPHNMKLAATLNNCLAVAKGEYIARMDGDDLCAPTRFEKQVKFLDEHPEYSIVSCPMIHFDDNGEYGRGKAVEKPTNADFANGTPFCHAPCMMRTTDLMSINGYETKPEVTRMEDFYLWYKFYRAGYKGYNLQEHLYMMRDDREAASRRKVSNRMVGAKTDIEIYRGLGLPKILWIKTVLRNLVLTLMPTGLYLWLHKKRQGRMINKHK